MSGPKYATSNDVTKTYYVTRSSIQNEPAAANKVK